ncbi:globin domain-containing protein [Streptomyces sp. 7N604]|uniref:globin domain-containing protein n=1 Tax=Streptomyces sp. 7N604 TaxID=3457415 RepID=UPI003FD19C8A
MDAPTTTPADNGGSGGDGGDWGWFTPTAGRKRSAPEGGDGNRDQNQDQGDDRIPSRPVSAIRPVGGRGSERHPAQEPPATRGGAATRDAGDEHQRTTDRSPRQGGAPEPGDAPPSPYVAHHPGPAPQGGSPSADSGSPHAPGAGGPAPAGPRTTPPYFGAGQDTAAPTGPREHGRPAPPGDQRIAPASPYSGSMPDSGTLGVGTGGSAARSARPGGGTGHVPAAPAAEGSGAGSAFFGPGAGARPDGPGAPGQSAPAASGRPVAVDDRRPTGPAPGTTGLPTEHAPGPARATDPGHGAPATAPGDRSEAASNTAAGAASAAPAGGEPASPDAILIRRTMAEIEPIADKVTSYFYAMLFVRHPDLRALFPAAMDTQRDRLFKALLTAAKHVDDGETLTAYLANLGRGHRKYGTRPEHYPAVGECLLAALSRYASESWGPETEAAWIRAYTAISQIMIDAAAADELRAPAWWEAEVVAHDLRTSDIAIITVRPDQPYPFRAGQYATLETPWWPRVWRHYSFSSAPRPDGLLSFHVKAVPAGWVSNALVHRARPGDIIRLGPPGGSMTVDHNTDSGLLCLGGGTGIAPIKALVEDVAEHGRKRPVDVFYGARSDHDLYDIDTMLRLEQAHSWLSVRPVVADGPTPAGGLSGPLPEAVRQYGPWNAYDAYLSGPPGMIRSGVDTLVGIGVPSHRIRHDSIEELVAAGPGQGV